MANKITQPRLFAWQNVKTTLVELFPAVWASAEAISAPDLETRLEGLTALEQTAAAYFSPLVAYIIATRLIDPDLKMRSRVIRILGDVLRSGSTQEEATIEVHQHVAAYLSQMRTRQILFVLQAVAYDSSIDAAVVTVLKECSPAGEFLAGILADRKMAINIRKLACWAIGEIGYLEAIPTLERLLSRLEVRAEGQKYMPFHVQEQNEENQLLPAIHDALVRLQAP
jgi:HEAT repeat protein